MAHIGKSKETRKGTAYPVRWRDPAGRFKEKWVYGKRAAERECSKIEADLARGTYVDDRLGKKPLCDVADEWLASVTNAKPRTRAEYRRLLDTRVLLHFGHRRAIGSLKRSDVAGYVNWLAGEGLRPQTISRAFHPLRALLRYAAQEGNIRTSPAVRVALPDERALEQETFEARYLTWPQVESLAAELGAVASMYATVVRLTALTGLRAGEVAGLNVGDVAILGDRGTLTVLRTRSLTRQRGWVTSVPKSKRSRREVPVLSADVVAELAAHLAAHPRRGEAGAPLFYGREPYGLHRPDPTRYWDPSTFYRRTFCPAAVRVGLHLRPVVDRRGEPLSRKDGQPVLVSAVRFHDLRHTAASLWANAGIDMFRVSRWLGHASLAITDSVYAHLFKTDHAADAHALTAFLGRQLEEARAEAAKVTELRRNA